MLSASQLLPRLVGALGGRSGNMLPALSSSLSPLLMAQQSASFASRAADSSMPAFTPNLHTTTSSPSPFYRTATSASTHATLPPATAAAVKASSTAQATASADSRREYSGPPPANVLYYTPIKEIGEEPKAWLGPYILPELKHGGPGTVPYAKPPSKAKYSALWEYETYRKLPVKSAEEMAKHEPYARELHAHKYPFLHVDPTPWPPFCAFHMSGLFWGLVLYTHFAQPDLFIMAFIGTSYGWAMWWRDITRESLLEGKHTIAVKATIRYAFVLFIASEVLFFITLFWGYYHNLSNPIWLIMPDEMVIKGWGIPLLNTAILLSSGAAVTWAHHATICAKEIMKKTPK